MPSARDRPSEVGRSTTLLLCGDVMLGRGIDQILPHPSAPHLHESYVRDARDYVRLAEVVSGPIPACVDPPYVWGDALAEAERLAPEVRILNLETSVTTSEDDSSAKGIHYRMHPANIGCLLAMRPDVCVLANNHVLDYGPAGLLETLETLERAAVRLTGAGRTLAEAQRPAIVPLGSGRRLLVFAYGTGSSGIPDAWAATEARPGLSVLPDLSAPTARLVVQRIASAKEPGDLAVLSMHWGSNWGYDVPADHVAFAHQVVEGGADIVFGHSSHHPRPIEVYHGHLILYGCGDFIDDYEGIGGYDEYRDELRLMYVVTCHPDGRLASVEMSPMHARNFRLHRASPQDLQWIEATLTRVGVSFGTRVEGDSGGRLRLVVL